MEGLLERPAFAVAGTDYRWADVIALARHRGAWAGMEGEIREGLACQRLASDTKSPLSAGQVWSAATTFRYQRRLTSAEETEAWLARWHVTKDEWLDYLRRSLLRQRHASELSSVVSRYGPTDDEVSGVAWPTGVCSGKLEEFVQDLAARLVAMELSASVPHGQVSEQLDALESAYDDWCRQLGSAPAIAKAISSHHLDWIHLHTRSASFATEEVAREAIMCVRMDGMSLSEVSALAGTTVRESRFFLEDSEPTMRDHLVAVADGEVLGPFASPHGFTVVEVVRKALPSSDDAEVARRAGSAVVSRAVRQEVANRVKWYDPL